MAGAWPGLPTPRTRSTSTGRGPASVANSELYALARPRTRAVSVARVVRDLVALTKPRITALVLMTWAPGAWLAPGHVARPTLVLSLVGTALIVGAANVLNM